MLIIVLALGLVIGCGGGEKPAEDTPSSTDHNDTPVNEVAVLDNLHESDWYTIEYPNSWTLEEDEGTGETTLTPNDAGEFNATEITISNTPIPGLSSASIDELIEETKKQPGGDQFEISKIDFNGYTTMMLEMNVMGINIETYNIPIDGAMPIVTASFDDSSEEAVRDMLSTFKLK